jgi:hypothetical protein
MSAFCLPAGVATLAHAVPGATVEVSGTVGRDAWRCPLTTGSIVHVLGRTGNGIRVRLPDGAVLLIDECVAALVRVEPVALRGAAAPTVQPAPGFAARGRGRHASRS